MNEGNVNVERMTKEREKREGKKKDTRQREKEWRVQRLWRCSSEGKEL